MLNKERVGRAQRGLGKHGAAQGQDLTLPGQPSCSYGDLLPPAPMEVKLLFLLSKEGLMGPSANSTATWAICRQPGAWGKLADSTWFLSLSVFINAHFSFWFIPEDSFSGHLRNALRCQAAVFPQLVVAAREVGFLICYIVRNLRGANRCQ